VRKKKFINSKKSAPNSKLKRDIINPGKEREVIFLKKYESNQKYASPSSLGLSFK
jgi:hypothetical protein